MSDALAAREFSMAGQESFARLAGDANPMHVDRVAARRTEPGEPIVHAMHAMLWAFDVLCERGVIDRAPASIDARFARFIYPETTVSLEVVERTADVLRIALASDAQTAFAVAMRFTAQPPRARPPIDAPPMEIPASPIVLDTSEMAGRAGSMPSMVDDRIVDEFPNAVRVFTAERVKGLAALSALVGMVVPGMHPIFSRFDVDLTETPAKDGALRFEARKVDERFRIVDIAVEGSGLAGTAYAFARKPPVEQRSVRDLAGIVTPDEFASTNALVVGGSRGLGAATAKIIAAGGGRVAITYLVGEEEARATAAELGEARCTAVQFDVRDDPAGLLSAIGRDVDHVYYFATPQVRRQKRAWFEADRFEKLIEAHVIGFERLCDALRARGKPVSIFYPSTTALDDETRGVVETRMSKAAGEQLCAELGRQWVEARIIARRLPPVLTDQTAAVKPAKLLDAADVMLPIVREMVRSSA